MTKCSKCNQLFDPNDNYVCPCERGPTFESADSDKPEEIIKATQKALIQAMRNIMVDMKKDVGGPGMTWEQIDFFLETGR
jgi:hypothetical protein